MSINTGHKAKKSLGQNFLTDENIARKIVDRLRIAHEDQVLEIGPGRGALTRWIAGARPLRFLALEKDRELAPRLPERFEGLEVVEGDALEYPWETLAPGPWKIVGNLPYNIGSKLVWDIVRRAPFERCVFMLQHEVALRLAAQPGTKAFGALTVWVQNHAEVDYLFKVPPQVFTPRPKVDSAVVLLRPLAEAMRPKEPERLAWLAKTCFMKRRKQFRNVLGSLWSKDVEQWFESQGIPLTARPENLKPQQFSELASVVKSPAEGTQT